MIDYSEGFGRVFFLGKKAHHLVREGDCVCADVCVVVGMGVGVGVGECQCGCSQSQYTM